MLTPYIATIQMGNLQIQSTYTRPTFAIVEVVPEPYNPFLTKEELKKIKRPIKHIELPRIQKLTELKQKPIPKPKVVQRAVKRAPVGWYPKYQCTWWVWTKRPVPSWNNASDWLWQAKRDGWTISKTPIAGAIGWTPGHVVFIEAVNDNSVTISEANYDSNGSIRRIDKPSHSYTYIY